MDLAVAMRTVLRWFWLIVLATAIGAVSAFGVSTLMPVRYDAEALLLVGSLTATDPDEQLGYRQLAETYAGLVRTPFVMDEVVNTLGLDNGAVDVGRRVEASNPGGQNIVAVRATAATYDDAARLAQAVAARLAEISAGTVPAGDSLATIIESAEGPTSPSSPLVISNVAAGAALGMLSGLSIAFVATSRRTAEAPTAKGWGRYQKSLHTSTADPRDPSPKTPSPRP